MSISLSLFYNLYLLLLLVFFVFSFFHIYHLVRFSALGAPTVLAIALYCAVTAAILMVSFNAIGQFDWQQWIEILPSNASLYAR